MFEIERGTTPNTTELRITLKMRTIEIYHPSWYRNEDVSRAILKCLYNV